MQIPKPGNAADFAPVFLTVEQVETVAAALAAYPPRMAAYTGLRAAEIAGLRVRDVNLAAGHIEVRQTLRRVNGAWITDTGSPRGTRIVPVLSRVLVTELRRYLLTEAASGDPDGLFWHARGNGSRRLDWRRPMDVGAVAGTTLPAVEQVGLPHMRFHDPRQTFASPTLAAGFKPTRSAGSWATRSSPRRTASTATSTRWTTTSRSTGSRRLSARGK